MISNFPINEVIPQIKQVLYTNSKLIIEAPAGAGKSTIVPISLLNEPWLEDKKIIVLEPRRVAARSVAIQMAKLLGEEVGKTVGYQIKMESCFSKDTKVLVVTEGVLTRKLQNDQALEDIACVIFDEFHERSIHTDLGLALSLQSQEMLRDDLKIVLMSATLNSQKLENLLDDVSIVKSQGRMYEVQEVYLEESIRHPNKNEVTDLICDITLSSLMEDEGDILIFLAGAKEINQLKQKLELKIKEDILVLPLHSNLSKKEQDLAINKNEKRKIILSTNLAQTSLTIEGIKVVIDSGLEKVSRFDYSNGMNHLELQFISNDSAIQRQGRAGRLSEGKCYKLWHKKRLLESESKPEILRVDLSSFLLDCALWGVDSLDELVLLDTPNKKIVEEFKTLLVELEMLDENGNITSLGEDAISLGMHPRLSYMLLKANDLGFAKQASIIASLLESKDIFSNEYNSKDFIARFEAIYESCSSRYLNIHRVKEVKKQAQFYLKKLQKIKTINENSFDKKYVSVILLFAYPDRLAKLKDENIYNLSNKKQAILLDEPILNKSSFLVAPTLSAKQTTSYINQALSIDIKDIEKYFQSHIKTKTIVEFKDKVQFKSQRFFEHLVLDEKPSSNVSQEQLHEAIYEYIKDNSIENVFEINKKLQLLINRVNFYNYHKSLDDSLNLPLWEYEDLNTNIKELLQAYMSDVKKFDDLKKLDLYMILSSSIAWEDMQKLEALVPETLKVPSGSKIKIDYSNKEAPSLQVKIQEVFGMMETPKVLNNQINLVIHLLNPAQRAIQITQDLKSFWENSYEEVRKELRGKYKKHYWPENPYEAIATNKTKKNM